MENQRLKRYYDAWRETNVMYENWAKAQGLSYTNILVLYALFENKENCTQKQISKEWLVPKQTINTILKNMEHKGYVEFSTLEEDKRNKVIHLTASGEAYIDKIIGELQRCELEVFEKMGDKMLLDTLDGMECFNQYFRETIGRHS